MYMYVQAIRTLLNPNGSLLSYLLALLPSVRPLITSRYNSSILCNIVNNKLSDKPPNIIVVVDELYKQNNINNCLQQSIIFVTILITSLLLLSFQF